MPMIRICSKHGDECMKTCVPTNCPSVLVSRAHPLVTSQNHVLLDVASIAASTIDISSLDCIPA